MARKRFIAGALILVGVLSSAFWGEGWAAERIEAETPDGITLVGELYLPRGGEKPPLLVLLHMLSRQRGDWRGLIPKLLGRGYAVLAMDLRGHGESTQKDGQRVRWREFSRKEYAKMPDDFGLMLEALAPYKGRVNVKQVGVIGASIGGNIALVAAVEHPEIKALILLSPGLDYRGIKTEGAIRRYGNRPICILVSEEDAYSASSSRVLFALARGPKELKIFKGSAHGTRIFTAEPASEQLLLECLAKHFPA